MGSNKDKTLDPKGKVVYGPYGEKVGDYTAVEEEVIITADGQEAEGAYIRWLIAEEDGAPLFALRTIRMKPGAKVPPHKHPWEHEIYVLRGKGMLWIEDRGYLLERGVFVYIPPNKLHYYYTVGEEELEFVCIIPNKPTVEEE